MRDELQQTTIGSRKHQNLPGLQIPSELHSSSRDVMVWVIEHFEKEKRKNDVSKFHNQAKDFGA